MMRDIVDQEYKKLWRQVSKELWSRVKAFHAECQINQPNLRMSHTVMGLIREGLCYPETVQYDLAMDEKQACGQSESSDQRKEQA